MKESKVQEVYKQKNLKLILYKGGRDEKEKPL